MDILKYNTLMPCNSGFLMDFSFTPCSTAPLAPRTGLLNTPHGTLETPAFIFCATKGAIKGLTMEAMREEGTQIVLANTFHLMLSPGGEGVRKLGGLAKMSGWNGPTLTDSGGYQVFSMGYGSVAEEIKGNRHFASAQSRVTLTEEGARFKSAWDGSYQTLTPEKSIEIQEAIGADIILAFDECTPFHVERAYTEASMRRSHRWEKRSLMRFEELEAAKEGALPQALYGIIQGGVYEDLRKESCAFVNEEAFWGQAVGGSLGATKEQMRDVVALTMGELRRDRPTHLLGIGRIEDIFHGVSVGIDTFDCVHPTRIARHGSALVRPALRERFNKEGLSREHINLKNSIFAGDPEPIEEECSCLTCQTASRGYLHHLLKNQEMLGPILIARHNVHFMNALMAAIRKGIHTNTLEAVRQVWLGR